MNVSEDTYTAYTGKRGRPRHISHNEQVQHLDAAYYQRVMKEDVLPGTFKRLESPNVQPLVWMWHDNGKRTEASNYLMHAVVKFEGVWMTRCSITLLDRQFYLESPRPDDVVMVCDWCLARKPFPVGTGVIQKPVISSSTSPRHIASRQETYQERLERQHQTLLLALRKECESIVAAYRISQS